MFDNEYQVMELIEAIEADWALCDDNDEDVFLVPVNENREQHKTLRPLRSLVQELETEGYISFDEIRSDPKEKEREYMDFADEKIPIPLVYFFKVTDKGKNLYGKLKHS